MLRQGSVSDPDIGAPWYANGLRFVCTSCGNCCSGAPGYVWVTAAEMRSIAHHLNLSQEDFSRKHTRRVGLAHSLLERPGGDCEFLERVANGKTRCRIHPARPVQCRTWPFWKSNLGSPRAWEVTARQCPGINLGEHHPLAEIERLLRENGRRPL
jgi:hypothetical protein